MSNNKTFGEVLRNRRIELGAEINDISKSLHIKPTYLKAIENSNIDAMPSKAQARGFVSIYSEYLGLNKNEILSLFENQYTLQSDLTNGDIVDNYADHDNSAVFFNSSQENINIEKNNIVKLSEIIFQELGNDINKQRKKMGLSY